MNHIMDSSVIVYNSKSDVGDDSKNISLEHQVTTATSIQHESEGHASFFYNDIDTQNKPSQCTDLLEVDKETSSSNLAKNKSISSSKRRYNCDQCDFSTCSRQYFEIHFRKHTGERPYACDVCDYKFGDASTLIRHKKRHSGVKKYQCSQCDFGAHEMNYLARHMHKHTGEWPYACDICEYKCSSRRRFADHKSIHFSEKKYKCSQCEFESLQKSVVVLHLRTHSGERVYACDVCEYKCKSSSALSQHKKKHSSVKNFKCDKCSYACVSTGSLTRHKLIHSQYKPHQCDKCAYSSVDRRYLANHMKRHRKCNPKAAALSFKFGPKRDFNSTTTDYNMQGSDQINQTLDPSDIAIKSEPDVGVVSENMSVEHQVTSATSIQPLEDLIEQKPNIHADTNSIHIEIKSQGHASFSYNDIDTQNKPSQRTDLLEETDKETSSSNLAKNKSSRSLKKMYKSSSYLKKMYKCEQCDFTSCDRSCFVIHVRTHSGERPCASVICEFKSLSHGAPTEHHKLDTAVTPASVRKFHCDKCFKSFLYKTGLTRHERIHSEIKPYKCDKCAYSTANKGNFELHKNRHLRPKVYQCGKCEHTSLDGGSLATHSKVHLKRNYQCDKCAYSTVDTGSFEVHKNRHLRPKLYQCDKCEYTSLDRWSLATHRKVHWQGMYQCDECTYTSANRTSVLVHRQRLHIRRKPKAVALSSEFGPKRDFNSTTTDYNMQKPADSEAIEGTVKVEIEEHPIDVKPELDLMPTFDRHYVFLPEGPT